MVRHYQTISPPVYRGAMIHQRPARRRRSDGVTAAAAAVVLCAACGLKTFTTADGLNRVWRQCIEAGMAGTADADRDRVAAMAQHALRVADDPAALFASNVRAGRWHVISALDFDRADRLMRRPA